MQRHMMVNFCSCCLARKFSVPQNPLTSVNRGLKLAAILQTTNNSSRSKDSMATEWKMYWHNKTVPIIRNDVSGIKVPFKRAGVWYNLHPPKKKKDPLTEYVAQAGQVMFQQTSTDDVYVANKFNVDSYSVKDALVKLRHITNLDMTPPSTPVLLKFDLNELLTGKGKRKRPYVFRQLVTLPNRTRFTNSVGVFTNDNLLKKMAVEKGAAIADDRPMIMEASEGQLDCDLFATTDDFLREMKSNTDLQQSMGYRFPTKETIYDNPDQLLASLARLINDTIFTNMRDPKTLEAQIGTLEMDDEQLAENVEASYEFMLNSTKRKVKKSQTTAFVNAMSLSCETEELNLKMQQLINEEDLS